MKKALIVGGTVGILGLGLVVLLTTAIVMEDLDYVYRQEVAHLS